MDPREGPGDFFPENLHLHKDQDVELIIVCCHAIYTGSRSCSPRDEMNWLLAPFQRSNPTRLGEHVTFLQHMHLALLTLVQNHEEGQSSVLIFSGGSTKRQSTILSEARSYLNAITSPSQEYLHHRSSSTAREAYAKELLLLEEYATDSYQNLLFSILRFHQVKRHFPASIRIISHAFKTKRFLNLHANAIRWPTDRITASGLDPPMTSKEYEETLAAGEKHGFQPFVYDPHGIGDVLHKKRQDRGYDLAEVPYVLYAEHLQLGGVTKLLRWSFEDTELGSIPSDLPWITETSISESGYRKLFALH